MSKPIPIGDQTLDIERNIFNANMAKKLADDKVDVLFLDHGNLAEQGYPIKPYYRQDLVHLADEGVEVYTTNIRKMIARVLKKDNAEDDEYWANNIHLDRRDQGQHYRARYSNESQVGYKDNIDHHNTFRKHNDGYHHRRENRGPYGRNSDHNTYSGRDDNSQYIRDYRGDNANIGHRSTFRRRDEHNYGAGSRGHNEDNRQRSSYSGNRNEYRRSDTRRDQFNYWDESDVIRDNRDNRFTFTTMDDTDRRHSRYGFNKDSYYSGRRGSESERRYNENRYGDYEYYYSQRD